MWRSATTRRTRKAAMSTAGGAVRVCTYIRCATEEPRPHSIDAQAATIRAFIATRQGWHLIEPLDDTAIVGTTQTDSAPAIANAPA